MKLRLISNPPSIVTEHGMTVEIGDNVIQVAHKFGWNIERKGELGWPDDFLARSNGTEVEDDGFIEEIIS